MPTDPAHLTLFDAAAPEAIAADVVQPTPGAARAGDPETSRRAARNVMPGTGTSRAQVLLAFDQAGDGMTDDEMYALLGDHRSSRWRTARHELATLYDPPLLEHKAGDERPTRSGGTGRVWRVTVKGAGVAHHLEMEGFGASG